MEREGHRCGVQGVQWYSLPFIWVHKCVHFIITHQGVHTWLVFCYICVLTDETCSLKHINYPPTKNKRVTSCAWLCLHRVLFQNHPEREKCWEEVGAGALLMNWLPLEFTLIDANWIVIETIYPGPRWTWKKLQYLEATPQSVCKQLSHCTILPSTLFVY